MSGSLSIWLKGMSYHIGGQSSDPSAIRMPGYPVRPRCKNWLRNRLQPSGYPQLRRKNPAGGMAHLAWLAWDAKISSPSSSRPQGPIHVVRRDQMVALAQALQQCAKLSRAPLAYSVVPSRTSIDTWNQWLRGVTWWMPPCWRLWMRILWLPQALQWRPCNWERNQNYRRSEQLLFISPSVLRRLLSLREPSAQGWW